MLTALFISCSNREKQVNTAEIKTSGDSSEIHTIKEDSSIHIQELFTGNVSDLVNMMAAEKYRDVLKLLQAEENRGSGTELQQAYFRYIKLDAVCGLTGQGKKKKYELKKLMEDNLGKTLLLNHQEITKGHAMPFNQLRVEEDSSGNFKSTRTNNEGTQIHFFVNLKHEQKTDLSKNIGKHAYIFGVFEKFRLSAEGINSWVAEIWLKQGSFIILEDEFNRQKQ